MDDPHVDLDVKLYFVQALVGGAWGPQGGDVLRLDDDSLIAFGPPETQIVPPRRQ